jgi:hypothetical protein
MEMAAKVQKHIMTNCEHLKHAMVKIESLHITLFAMHVKPEQIET